MLVDTSVWSLVFRRRLRIVDRWTTELNTLIFEERAFIIGAVRQQLLSGIRQSDQFDLVRRRLRPLPDLAIHGYDYEQAAIFCNQCRGIGVQGSSTDFLICAAAWRLSLSIFTTDSDFHLFQRILPIKLHEVR